MDNREILTPSSGDAILKRHLFSGVAKNWIKDRGDVGERISCADQVDRASDSEWPLRAAQFLKPPTLPGDTYLDRRRCHRGSRRAPTQPGLEMPPYPPCLSLEPMHARQEAMTYGA